MTSKAEKLGKTGERMVPELHQGSLIYSEHMTRYQAAQALVADKVVLDIACGSGYGTKLLADVAAKVYGVDLDKDTIAYAKEKFSNKNTEYITGSATEIPLKDNSVDVVITFETIEHVENYKKFIKEIKRVLRPDGIAIVSTPNELEFAEGNHFHLHEFEYEELVNLLKEDFSEIDPYFQATLKFVAVGPQTIFEKNKPFNFTIMNHTTIKPPQALYFYLVCSNQKIAEKVEPVGATGELYSDRAIIGMQMRNEQNISDYKTVNSEQQTQITELHSQLQVVNKKLFSTEKALTEIVQSKAYKYAKKLATVKKRVFPHGKTN